jgi:ABC-2 type transport system permease protein
MQIDSADVATPQKYRDLFALFHAVLTVPQLLLLSVLLPYYLLDCLYAERKDRSILFWKALPVSDAQTVLSKLLVALVVVPLGVFVLTLFTDVVASGILDVRFRKHTQGLILAAVAVAVLWYAPIAAYLMLISAWAKRNAFLWAVLPPLVAMLIERIAFGTHEIAKFLGYRLHMSSGVLGINPAAAGGHAAGMFDTMRPWVALVNIDFWLGLAVAAALVWLTIRIRRHQEDG